MISKKQLRAEIATKRRTLDPDWISTSSDSIADRLQQLDVFQTAGTVALYKALKGEVDLDCLFQICREQGKRTCMPVFNAEESVYALAEITSQTRFIKGYYGIREPESPVRILRDQIDLMIVPGVAFDPAGNRLGRGGGYYDRLLDGFHGSAVAVAFDFQLYSYVPRDSNDIPVDMVVTETKTVKVQNEH